MCRTNYHGTLCQDKGKLSLIILCTDQIPSKLKYYLMAFALLGLIIGGIFLYIKLYHVDFTKPPEPLPELDPISGSNPEPSQAGKYGL